MNAWLRGLLVCVCSQRMVERNADAGICDCLALIVLKNFTVFDSTDWFGMCVLIFIVKYCNRFVRKSPDSLCLFMETA